MGGGTDLARAYATEVVEPLLRAAFPRLPVSIARLGSGSDVLGLDDAVSRDHDWGLRLTVVVPEGDVAPVDALLESGLPGSFRGLPTRFPTTWEPRVRHRAEVASVRGLALAHAGVDPNRPLTLLDHASLTGQAVLELTAGPVLRDDGGVLAGLRDALRPPEDVRRWAIASAWHRLEDELPFVGRTAERGDDLGSRAIAARLVTTAMRLGFLLERRPAPYAKWLGTAFAALPRAGALVPALRDAAAAAEWRAREEGLVTAIEALAVLQAEEGLPALRPACRPFWDRPFRTVGPVDELVRGRIEDPVVRRLPLVGPPDLWSAEVRILVDHDLRRRMVAALVDRARQDGVGDPA